MCARCGERGHLANSCRNPVTCFVCNGTGHKSYQWLSSTRALVNRRRIRANYDDEMQNIASSFNRCIVAKVEGDILADIDIVGVFHEKFANWRGLVRRLSDRAFLINCSSKWFGNSIKSSSMVYAL